jgi:hypothetical protein
MGHPNVQANCSASSRIYWQYFFTASRSFWLVSKTLVRLLLMACVQEIFHSRHTILFWINVGVSKKANISTGNLFRQPIPWKRPLDNTFHVSCHVLNAGQNRNYPALMTKTIRRLHDGQHILSHAIIPFQVQTCGTSKELIQIELMG